MPTIYLTILKWVGLAAAIIALIGVPVYYVNHRIDLAHTQGYSEGYDKKSSEVAAGIALAAKRSQEIMLVEAQRAQKAEEENAKLVRKVNDLQDTVRRSFVSIPVCDIPPNVTSLLRNAALGNFDSGNPVPNKTNDEVPRSPAIPREDKSNG